MGVWRCLLLSEVQVRRKGAAIVASACCSTVSPLVGIAVNKRGAGAGGRINHRAVSGARRGVGFLLGRQKAV